MLDPIALGIAASVVAVVALGLLLYLLSGRRFARLQANTSVELVERSVPRTYIFRDNEKIDGLYSDLISPRRDPERVEVEIDSSHEGGLTGGEILPIEARTQRNTRRTEQYGGRPEAVWRQKPPEIEATLKATGQLRDVSANLSTTEPQLRVFLDAIQAAAQKLQFSIPQPAAEIIADAWREAHPPLDAAALSALPSYVSLSADFTIVERPQADGTGALRLEVHWDGPNGPLELAVLCGIGEQTWFDAALLRNLQGNQIQATCVGKVIRSGNDQNKISIAAAYCYAI